MGLRIVTDEASYPTYLETCKAWEAFGAEVYAPVLRRWIASQVAVALLPFAGFGETLAERVTLLGVRFTVVKLALMSLCAVKQVAPDQADAVQVIQSLSRFLDHLADPTMMRQICEETGWVRENRLRGLIGDVEEKVS